jgi:hypothetical protein
VFLAFDGAEFTDFSAQGAQLFGLRLSPDEESGRHPAQVCTVNVQFYAFCKCIYFGRQGTRDCTLIALHSTGLTSRNARTDYFFIHYTRD